jgi:tetratricopeptide (TPR) repeat protein
MNDILFAFYDLALSPVSFDFSSFLVCADAHRRKVGLRHIHFVVVPAKSGTGHWDNQLHLDDHLKWRLNNVLVPLSGLVEASSGLSICATRDEAARLVAQTSPDHIFPETYSPVTPVERHHTGWTVILATQGEPVQCVRASEQARRYARQWIDARAQGRKCVALTLREADFGQRRNSDPVVWGGFARKLLDGGYFPVILRDIDTALGPVHPALEGFATFTEGVFNLDLRIAFYEEAHVHASVANGPCHTCFYDRNVRYLYVVSGDWLTQKPTPFGRIGIEFGEQPPFTNRYQRWMWKEQDADVIMSEFLALDAAIDQDRAAGTFEAGLDPVLERRLPIPMLCERYRDWSQRSYLMAPEELRLLVACRNLLKDKLWSAEERLEMLADIALCSNDLASAAAFIESRGERFGYHGEMFARLGIIKEALGEYAESQKYFLRCVEENLANAEIIYRLGVVARKLGNLPLARKCFEGLVRRGSTYAEIFRELGEIYSALGEPDLARDILSRVGAVKE